MDSTYSSPPPPPTNTNISSALPTRPPPDLFLHPTTSLPKPAAHKSSPQTTRPIRHPSHHHPYHIVLTPATSPPVQIHIHRGQAHSPHVNSAKPHFAYLISWSTKARFVNRSEAPRAHPYGPRHPQETNFIAPPQPSQPTPTSPHWNFAI